jgi:hypothetical protein
MVGHQKEIKTNQTQTSEICKFDKIYRKIPAQKSHVNEGLKSFTGALVKRPALRNRKLYIFFH